VRPSALAVLALLRARPEGITALDALRAGCGDRLAARVHELREGGYQVSDSWETTPGGARVKRYRWSTPPAGRPYSGSQQRMRL
jgi:hypothetical protein